MMIDKREYDVRKMFRPVETSLSFERSRPFQAKCLHERLAATPTGNNSHILRGEQPLLRAIILWRYVAHKPIKVPQT
jgi:hypothetical protein